MQKTDEVSTDVKKLITGYENDTNKVAIDDIVSLYNIVDNIFEGFTEDFEDRNSPRDLTLEERGQILDALTNVYSVDGMDRDELNDELFNEYID